MTVVGFNKDQNLAVHGIVNRPIGDQVLHPKEQER